MSNYVITSIRDGWMHFPSTPVIYTDAAEALAKAAEIRADFPRAQVKVLRLVDDVEIQARGDYVARYHEALERQRQAKAREQSGDPNR